MRPNLATPLLLPALLVAAGCSPRLAATPGEALADPAAVAAELARASLPDTLLQVTFAWSYSDADARLRGRGVARVDAPERVRLDLFGPQGESYLAAALVGEELRAPAAAARLELPSPALLWGALGVIRLPTGAEVVEGSVADGVIVLRVDAGGDSYRFEVEQDGGRLLEVARLHRGRPLESVLVRWEGAAHPAGARYRHLAEFRELTLEIEELRAAAPFPPRIWTPDGT
jgi:hypothetical protein